MATTICFATVLLPSMSETVKRETFTNRTGFVLTAMGCAIGLGNFWRFPYLVDKYGGGTFILIYIIATLTFGLVLVLLEIAIGRKTGKSIIEAYGDLRVKHKWLGGIAIIIAFVLLGYYCVIGGWIMKYAFSYATGDIASHTTLESLADYFASFVSNTGDVFNGPVIWFVIFLLLSTVLCIGGLRKGAEAISKVFLPILLVIMLVLVVIILTIPGIGPGVEKMFVPTMAGLNANSVVAAVGQVFFSMSLATGQMVTFGSYLDKKTNIRKTMSITVGIECTVAICCAMLVVPLTFAFAGETAGGPGLVFVVLPALFSQLGMGRVIGALFFLLVFLAAWTSSVSITESIVAPLRDSFKMSRKNAIFAALAIGGVIGFLCSLSYGSLSGITIGGMHFLGFMDFATSNILMPLSAIIMCIIIGYIVKPKTILSELDVEEGTKHATYFNVMIKYICPVILVTILVIGLIRL